MKKHIKQLLAIFLVVFTIVNCFGINGYSFTTVKADSKLRLSVNNAKLKVGSSLTIKLLKEDGSQCKNVKWSSTNRKKISVNKKGKITAKKIGSATITASYGGRTYKCKVKAEKKYPEKNSSIVASQKEITILCAKEEKAIKIYTDASQSIVYKFPDSISHYRNKNEYYQDIYARWGNWSKNGIITLYIRGEQVTNSYVDVYDATNHKIKDRIHIKVIYPIESMKFKKKNYSLGLGLEKDIGEELEIDGYYSSYNRIWDENKIMKSSNPEVVKVVSSEKGTIKTVGVGTATITVTSARTKKTASCNITVFDCDLSLIPNQIPFAIYDYKKNYIITQFEIINKEYKEERDQFYIIIKIHGTRAEYNINYYTNLYYDNRYNIYGDNQLFIKSGYFHIPSSLNSGDIFECEEEIYLPKGNYRLVLQQ
jgi:hypothetical protein